MLDEFSENYFTGDTYHFLIVYTSIRRRILKHVFLFFIAHAAAFDEPMDGVVYGVAASLGYAAYENIEYVLYVDGEPSFDIALLRLLPILICYAV